MKLLKTLGIINVILLAAAQLIFRHGFLDFQEDIYLALNGWQNALLVLSTALIAMGGFLINAVAGDEGNKSGLSETTAYNVYAALTIAGVGIGFYLANHIEKPMFVAIFIAAAFGMYLYATSLKNSLIVSNITLALLIVLPVLVVGTFNLYPVIYTDNLTRIGTIFIIILEYCAFSFVVALVLTFVTDLANTDADYNNGTATLPIAIGKKRTARIAFFISLIPAGMLLYYANANLKEHGLWLALGFLLLFILGPLVWFLITIWDAKSQKEFSLMEKVLKAALLMTAVSVAVVTYNIHHNA